MSGEIPPRELKSEFTGLLSLFFVFTLYGYYYGVTHPEIFKELTTIFQKIFMMEFTPDAMKIFILVVINNLIKTFLGVILGYTIIYPFMFASFNGFILGVFLEGAGREVGLFSAIMAVLPHGIIEIPAAIFSAAIGLKLGMDRFTRKRFRLSMGLKTYRKNVIPLIILAALIEAFVTPVVTWMISM